jgi:prolyl oligopeptidase
MNHSMTVAVFLAFCSLTLAAPPETPKKTITDTYHKTKVDDDYRWLEDWTDKTVQAWSEAQNVHARSVLDKLAGVEPLREKLTKIMAAKRTTHGGLTHRNGQLFAMRNQPPKQQAFLVVMPFPGKPEEARVLVDPNEIDKKGGTHIDWYVPSPDGKLVSVSISKGGSESGDVHIFDVASGKQTDVVIPRVHGGTAAGYLAWAPDGKGFYYTRYPREKERPAADMDFFQQLYFHELGTPGEKDRYEIGKDFPRIAEVQAQVEPKTGRVLVTVQNGDSGEFAMHLRSTDGKWTQFADIKDGLVQAAFGPDGDIYAVSRKGAPRGKIVKLSGEHPEQSKAVVVVPEGKDTVVTSFYLDPGQQTMLPTASRLFVTYQLGGPSAIRAFTLEGKPAAEPKQPAVAAIGPLVPAGGDDLLFSAGSFTDAGNTYLYKAGANETQKLDLNSPPVVDFSDIEVVRDFATSKDGTKVPVSILMKKGTKLDGSNPCLATGYGGYAISIQPGVSAVRRVLFDHGFVVAVANLRGGAEFGEEWHTEGNLTRKQNVFDDFAAVLKLLIDKKYTSPAKLAIEGGSNGGLLMGATLTQHPELMKCVVTHVGIYDMLRVELSPNGAFNIPEFGTVKDAAQFEALYAYSPYHRVKDGAKYPPVLFLTGANDPRVDPMQSRKMTARLQAVGTNALLRTSASTGHGAGTPLNARIEEMVDVYAFLFDQLGVKVKE